MAAEFRGHLVPFKPTVGDQSHVTAIKALRGSAISFRSDPFETDADRSLTYIEDALIVIEGGKICSFGSYSELAGTLPAGASLEEYPDSIITPGFIDTHVHYPQLQMIGAYGSQLLDWLNNHTFPAEMAFADRGPRCSLRQCRRRSCPPRSPPRPRPR